MKKIKVCLFVCPVGVCAGQKNISLWIVPATPTKAENTAPEVVRGGNHESEVRFPRRLIGWSRTN